MPPGLEERAPGWPAVGRVPADPGRSGPGDGRQRGIIQQARVPTDGRTPRNVAVEPAGAVPGRPGYRRVRLPGASRPVPALRSATREARKNARTPADMHGKGRSVARFEAAYRFGCSARQPWSGGLPSIAADQGVLRPHRALCVAGVHREHQERGARFHHAPADGYSGAARRRSAIACAAQRACRASHGGHVEHRLLNRRALGLVEKRGIDEPGMYRVHANAAAGPVQRDILRQRADRALCSVVGR